MLLKGFVKKFRMKVAQKFAYFWAILESVAIWLKTAVHTFWGTIEKIGLLLISTFGHSDWKSVSLIF